MILYSIILFIIAVFIFLLCTPIFLKIYSSQRLVQVCVWGIGRATLIIRESKIGVQLSILGWNKTIFPGQKTKVLKVEKKRAKTWKVRMSYRKILRKASSLVKSFRVIEFYLTVDTGDYVANAFLYPLAALLSDENREIQINFQGDVELRLQIVNSLQRMLRAYFR